MPELHFPWLEIAILLPLAGSLLVRFPKDRERARRISVVFASLTLLAAVGEWIDFIRLGQFEAHDHWDIVAAFMHQNVLVIDELSAPLFSLVALLYLLAIYSTLKTKVTRFSMSGTLLAEAILLATLSCRSGWLLIFLLAVGTLPVYYEIAVRRKGTARVFVIHMVTFVVCMTTGFALLPAEAVSHPNSPSFLTLIAGALLTFGALIRSGVAPLHCWMTDLFDRATFGTALLTVVPMPGAYAIMRLVLPVAPTWAMQAIAVISLITAVYAAAMSIVETDSRRFFCYLFLSNSSLVLAGLELVTTIGLTGALCLWISIGLSLGGLGLVLRSVESRVGRVDLSRYNGLYDHAPMLAGLFLVTGLASIGFPGTVGFVGIELMVEGAAQVYPLVGGAVVIASALCGIAMMRAYFRIFTGTEMTSSISFAAKPSERIAVVVLTLLILGGGLFPQPGVASRHHAAQQLLLRRQNAHSSLPKQSAPSRDLQAFEN